VHSTKGTELTVCGLEAGATYSFDVRSVAADGTKSSPATTSDVIVQGKSPSSLWVFTSIGIIALLAIAGFATFFAVNKHHTGHSLAVTIQVVARDGAR
jgi:hypothetical protein